MLNKRITFICSNVGTSPLQATISDSSMSASSAISGLQVRVSGWHSVDSLKSPPGSQPIKVAWPLGPGQSVIALSSGTEHNLLLTDCGALYAWGGNRFGQLGLGNRLTRASPESLDMKERILRISAGPYHNAALDRLGGVHTWGWGVHGQLGHGRTVEDELRPRKVALEEWCGDKVALAECGYAHTVFVMEDGGVWACGNSTYGQLGLGDVCKRSTLTKVKDIQSENVRVGELWLGCIYVYVFSFHNFLVIGSTAISFRSSYFFPCKKSFLICSI